VKLLACLAVATTVAIVLAMIVLVALGIVISATGK
jgi:hypothetical protein